MNAIGSQGELILEKEKILAVNPSAKAVLNHPDFDPAYLTNDEPTSIPFRLGDQWYQIRNKVLLAAAPVQEYLVTQENVTSKMTLQFKREHIQKQTRTEVTEQLKGTLGVALDELKSKIEQAMSSDEENPALLTALSGLMTLTSHCQRIADDTLLNKAFFFEQDTDIWAALELLIREVKEHFHFQVFLSSVYVPSFSTPEDRSFFFLLLQETIRNAYRHSGGTEMTIELNPTTWILEDNGTGLTEDCIGNHGMGCSNIIHRAHHLGFNAEVLTGNRNGWCFQSNDSAAPLLRGTTK